MSSPEPRTGDGDGGGGGGGGDGGDGPSWSLIVPAVTGHHRHNCLRD